MTDLEPYDVLVVGAGPAGLAASLVLGRQQRHVLLVDAGAPRNAPVQEMHMYLGFDGASPAGLRARAQEELAAHPNVTLLTGTVSALGPAAGETATESTGAFTAVVCGREITVPAVLLATGVRDVLDDLPGLAERWGRDVVHCAYCHGYEGREATIAVLAREPMDAMLARYVADRFSRDVTLYTHRIAGSQMVAVAQAGGVRLDERPVVRLDGEPGSALLELADGEIVTADIVFHRPRVEVTCTLASELGCEVDAAGRAIVSPSMETSVPGIFAAGDAAVWRDDPAPIDFVLAAAADGQRAAVWIENRLFAAALNPAG